MDTGDAFESEEGLFAALSELSLLSRPPMPLEGNWPPWERIRAALPPGAELPTTAVNVLVDLAIDDTGVITRAAVGHVPSSLQGNRVVAACVGPDGSVVVQPSVPEASPEVARAVAAAHLGERFSPGERNGVPVPVRLVRVGIAIAPGALQPHSAL